MSFRKSLVVIVLFLLASLPFAAMAQAPQPATAGGGTVHGLVLDPDDALIPGATATLTSAAGKAVTTTSKSDGTYTVRGLAAGTYTLSVTAPGFGTFVKAGINVTLGANVAADVKMTLQDTTETVTVSTDTVQLSVDPESNQSATVISGDALNALSDDPDELSAELAALAGPSMGPNGGQIYIDGFTGGQLPPKSSILAIRINSNPFSAQYDRAGYGRIEIITKPGADKFHGGGSIQGQDKIFNTSTPFLGPANVQPDYHQLFFTGNLTGPIRPGMSFTLNGTYRDILNNNIINPSQIYSSGPTSTTVCYPGDANFSSCSPNPYPSTSRAVSAPQTRWEINPRFDTMIGSKNTFTARYSYETGTQTNPGNGNSLTTQASSSSSGDHTIQLSDTQLLSNRVINETRFEFEHETSSSNPVNPGTTVSVTGNFTTHGTGSGGGSSTTNHIEIQNYTSIQLIKNFIRLGGRLRTEDNTINSSTTQNGSLSYSYLLDPCTDPGVPMTSKPGYNPATQTNNCVFSSIAPQSSDPVGAICAGSKDLTPISAYQCSVPYQFSLTKVNNPTISARETDVGFYLEDDWKALNNLTISYGIRMEAQSYINSTHDFAPRIAVAYGVPRKNGKPTITVLRGGFGIFYDRYGLGSITNLIQGNPSNQTTTRYQNPGIACTPSSTSSCTSGLGTGSSSQIQVPAAGLGLRAPYTIQAAATLEQKLGKYASLSVTYMNGRGIHQFLTRVFPIGSGNCPNPTTFTSGYVQCSQSEGIFRQNQVTTSIRIQTPKGTSITGFYSANWANSNTSGITDPYHPAFDYGRASFAVRSQMTLLGSIPLPFLITASPIMQVSSGRPYSITSGLDNNDDGVTDDRPAFANGPVASNFKNCTNVNNFNPEPQSKTLLAGESYTEIPVNFCTGPSNVSFNLRLSRTFGFGPKTEAALAAQARQAAQQAGGGPGGPDGMGGPGGGGPGGGGGRGGGGQGGGGGRGGGGGGGGGGGRGGGGFGGGRGSNTGRKYNLSLGLQVLNLFNEVPYQSPISNLSNSNFGKTTSIGGGFGSSNAVRHITLSANFNF
jgi:Carboxypeptidase regulatory-like domain